MKCFLDDVIASCEQVQQDLQVNMQETIQRLKGVKIGAFKPTHNKQLLIWKQVIRMIISMSFSYYAILIYMYINT